MTGTCRPKNSTQALPKNFHTQCSRWNPDIRSLIIKHWIILVGPSLLFTIATGREQTHQQPWQQTLVVLLHMHILGCVWLGNLDLDFKVQISDLQSNAKSENVFQRQNFFFFGLSFLPFEWEIQKRIWKTVFTNSGLACACIISKKKTAVQENGFANPFPDFPIEW